MSRSVESLSGPHALHTLEGKNIPLKSRRRETPSDQGVLNGPGRPGVLRTRWQVDMGLVMQGGLNGAKGRHKKKSKPKGEEGEKKRKKKKKQEQDEA